jgi:lipid II:glycine glycyltransferase (peptidoglycan interpeptide bridge formation enzyme)
MNMSPVADISSDIEDKFWDDFIAQNPSGHHVQTSLWAQVKSELGWKALRIKILKSGEIVAGAQILTRSLKPFGSIGYVPKGPVSAPGYSDQLDIVLQELLNLAGSNGLQLLAVQPPEQYPGLEDCFRSSGFCQSWLELVPTATVHLDLSASKMEILAQMKRQTRQNIRRSEREGMVTREGGLEDMDTFYKIHLQTSQRQKFSPYPEKYFKKMWEVLAGRGNLVNIIAEYEGEAVSSLLIVPFGHTVIAKVLGWSGNCPEKRPNDAVFWGAICWAKDHNYQWFDMEGIHRGCAQAVLAGSSIPEEYRSSPDFFKLGYGGQVILLPLAYDYVPNSILNGIYRIVFRSNERKESIHSAIDRIRRGIG